MEFQTKATAVTADSFSYRQHQGSHPKLRNTARALAAHAERINRSTGKRVLDIAVAAIALLFLAPAILLIMAAIGVESPGPVLFRQSRYGLKKRPFLIVKFRTMTVVESHGRFTQARRDDDRVTRVGRILRATSLDELPQLWNVLVGDMSIVGPRPHAVAMDDHFNALIRHYEDRHLVKPGITGLAQCQGYRGPTEDRRGIEGRSRRDRIYVRRWSLRNDILIMFRTTGVLFGPNAF